MLNVGNEFQVGFCFLFLLLCLVSVSYSMNYLKKTQVFKSEVRDKAAVIRMERQKEDEHEVPNDRRVVSMDGIGTKIYPGGTLFRHRP